MTPEERRAYIRAYQRTPQGRKAKQRSYMKHREKWLEYARKRYYQQRAECASM